jgi:hypothetical protein
LVGIALVVLCFHPGYMSADSVDQLTQARSGLYTTHHPPLMAWLWSWLDRVTPGPIGMLVLQNVLFWSALGILAFFTRKMPAILAGGWVLVVGLLPPCFSFIGTIWKDVHLGVWLLFASVLLVLATRYRSRSRWLALASLPFLFYGNAVRPNGLFAMVPLALWAVAVLAPSATRSIQIALGIVLAAALQLSAACVQDHLARGGRSYGFQYTLLYDLSAISVGSGENLLPSHSQRGPTIVTLSRLRQLYTPDNPDPLFFHDEPHLWGTSDPQQVRTTVVRWFGAVMHHPRIYLHHRLEILEGLLGLHSIGYTFHHGIDPNTLGVSLTPSIWNQRAMRYLDSTAKSPLFRSWVYLMLIVAVVGWMAFRRRWLPPEVVALSASAFCYAIPYALISPSQDFRYLWWPVLVALLLPVVALGAVVAREETASRSSPVDMHLDVPTDVADSTSVDEKGT